jgi:hypothetical protein
LALRVSYENWDETGRRWFKIVLLVCIADIFYFGTVALNAVTSLRFFQTNKKFACFMSFVFEMHFYDALAQFPTFTRIATSTSLGTASLYLAGQYLHVGQYSETNVMHFSLNLLRTKGLYMFRALPAHPQEALHK